MIRRSRPAEHKVVLGLPGDLIRTTLRLPLIQVGLFALTYFAVARTGLAFVIEPEGITPISPPSGLYLGILLITARRRWPGFAAAAYVADSAALLMAGIGLSGLANAAVGTSEGLLAATVITWICGGPPTLGRVRHVLALALGGAVAANAVTALGGALVTTLTSGRPFGDAFLLWWTASGIGMLAVAPLVVAMSVVPETPLTRRQLAGSALLLGAGAMSALVVFTEDPTSGELASLIPPIAVLPFLLWTAWRSGPTFTAIGSFLLCGIAVVLTVMGRGPFISSGEDVGDHLVVLQVFLGVVVISTLTQAAAVTEHRRSRAQLEHLARRTEAILESAGGGIIGVDQQGGVTFLNAAASAITGYESHDLIGLRLHEEIHHTKADGTPYPADDCPNMAVLEHGETHTMAQDLFWCKDGHSVPVESTSTPIIEDGVVTGAVVVFRDITERLEAESERNRAEAAVRGDRERLRGILDNATAMIYAKDRDGRFIFVNRCFESTFGLSNERTLERTDFDLFPKEWAQRFRANDCEVLERGTALEFEEVAPREDGLHTYVSTKFPLLDQDGVPYAVCGFSTDITERVRAEVENERLVTQLQQSERLESVGQLAGGIAHDFNNLLAVILNYAAFVRAELEEGGPLRQDVEEIHRAAERAAALTRQLLVFSRREVASPTVFDLNHTIAEIDRLLRRTIGEDIALVIASSPDPAKICADVGQMDQLMVNLAINARDAMPEGGRLTIATEAVDLDEAEARARPGLSRGPHVRLSFSDEGHGMDTDIAARAFEPFFTTKRKGEGTGLGLAGVYGTVQEAKGHVELRSAPEKGTVVEIHLPLVADAVPAAPVETVSGPEGRVAATVLLAEDEDQVRNVIRRILLEQGYEVLDAGSGEEALAHLESHDGRIDLLLTDLVMPGMSGKELADRTQELRDDLRVVFMSGYTDDAVLRRRVGEGTVTLLEKPFGAEALRAAVGSALNGDLGNGRGSAAPRGD